MTTYIPGGGSIQGFTPVTLEAIELRVISNLLQTQIAISSTTPNNSVQDELRLLRNDQAFELGITPPIVPGQ